jgi:tetratricopeptide (TPR) repeat protein
MGEMPDNRNFLISLVFLCTFPLFILPLNAQENGTSDSIIAKLEAARSTDERYNILLSSVDLYTSHGDYEKAVQYAKSALIEAQNEGKKRDIAHSLFIIGDLQESNDQYDRAIESYNESYRLYMEIEDEKGMADLCYSLGDIYKKKGFYQRSMERCLEGLSLYQNLEDTLGLSRIYNCMGSLYKYQDDLGKSIEYYNKSLDLTMDMNYREGSALVYNNIGVVHALSGNYDLALDYYKMALVIHIETAVRKNEAIVYGNMANAYLAKGEYQEAYDHLTRSIEINKEIDYKRGIAVQYENLGRYYYTIGDTGSAIQNYLIAYKMFNELRRLEYQKDIALTLSEVFSDIGDYEKAYKYLRENKKYSDSLFDVEKMKSIATLEQEYLNLRQIEEHRLKDQRSKIMLVASLSSLIMLIIIFSLLYSRQRLKLNQHKLTILNVELEKKQVEKDLEIRQKEITASTLSQARQNEIINDVISRLKSSLSNLKEQNQPVINDIIQDLSDNANPDIWQEFEVRFLQVHADFFENLIKKYPDLTNNEKRLAAFLRLDFSTKEISSITNQSPHSINIARTRLRKKLDIANTDINLASFLSNF